MHNGTKSILNDHSCFYAPVFHRMFLEILILGFHKYLLKTQVQENKDHLVRWKDFTSLCGTASQLMNDMKTSHWQWEKALFVARDATPMMTLNCLSEQEHLMIAYLHCLGIAYEHNGAKVILKSYCENHDCTKHFQMIYFLRIKGGSISESFSLWL